MVSPTTENRKWPGSISPACTGPTGISYTPGPSTVTEREGPVSRRSPVRAPASARIGYQSCGPVDVADQPARQWDGRSGRMPNRSRISRSNRPAGKDRTPASEAPGRLRASATHAARCGGPGQPARNRYTTRSLSPSSCAGDQGQPEAVLRQQRPSGERRRATRSPDSRVASLPVTVSSQRLRAGWRPVVNRSVSGPAVMPSAIEPATPASRAAATVRRHGDRAARPAVGAPSSIRLALRTSAANAIAISSQSPRPAPRPAGRRLSDAGDGQLAGEHGERGQPEQHDQTHGEGAADQP